MATEDWYCKRHDRLLTKQGTCYDCEKESPVHHCQNGTGDVCLAGSRDGICCPDDSCDIDDGVREAQQRGQAD